MRIRDTTIEQRSSSSSSSGSCSWILFNKTNMFFNFRETLICLCRYLCFHSSLTSLVYTLLLLLFSTCNRTFLFFFFEFHHQLLTHYFNWPFHDQPKLCCFIPIHTATNVRPIHQLICDWRHAIPKIIKARRYRSNLVPGDSRRGDTNVIKCGVGETLKLW